MVIYEILGSIGDGMALEREIREYTVTKNDKKNEKGVSFVCSRAGSIGIHTIYQRALDAELKYKRGIHFYTKDKAKLKEYGKLIDEHLEKKIEGYEKSLTKAKKKIGSAWKTAGKKASDE